MQPPQDCDTAPPALLHSYERFRLLQLAPFLSWHRPFVPVQSYGFAAGQIATHESQFTRPYGALTAGMLSHCPPHQTGSAPGFKHSIPPVGSTFGQSAGGVTISALATLITKNRLKKTELHKSRRFRTVAFSNRSVRLVKRYINFAVKSLLIYNRKILEPDYMSSDVLRHRIPLPTSTSCRAGLRHHPSILHNRSPVL